MRRMTWPALLLATTMVASAVTPCVADPTPVFGCGVSIRGRNVLTADMDCSSLNGPAILMENGASLDLGGFTVTANTIGIRCLEGKCKIEGPGTIRRFEFDP